MGQTGGVTMSGFVFQATVNPDHTLTLPPDIAAKLPKDEPFNVIIMVAENEEEERDWKRMAAEQFLAGYAPGDAIYDQYDQLRPR